MSRFGVRLNKLEAARPPQIVTNAPPIGGLQLRLEEIMARSERFNRLSAREQVAELRADLRAYQAKLRDPDARARSAIPGLWEKLIKCNFNDEITKRLHAAEVRLLAELGHHDARHPLTPEHREIIDLELFDA